MFDIGFSELMVIGVVALLVLGPERLPKVARTVGHLMGRLQRYVADVKSDINREMQIEELKRLQEDARKTAMELESSMRQQVSTLEHQVQDSLQTVNAAVADLENSIHPPEGAAGAQAVQTAQADQADHQGKLLDAASLQLDQQLAAAEAQAPVHQPVDLSSAPMQAPMAAPAAPAPSVAPSEGKV
ncbi:MAG: Sec-independent protein translocase protein TatB [Zoogloea sp.]|uniref:Sec-independent protein translocase protein TatB n=1 Tax=Zoogloea sp. TaxID=49181 RepID=UPI003F37828B